MENYRDFHTNWIEPPDQANKTERQQSKGRINAVRGDYADSRECVCECVWWQLVGNDFAPEPIKEITAVGNLTMSSKTLTQCCSEIKAVTL